MWDKTNDIQLVHLSIYNTIMGKMYQVLKTKLHETQRTKQTLKLYPGIKCPQGCRPGGS